MDNRPIGFFDSGLGGLTSIPVLKRELPHETVIYYGDTARTPYGSKSPETIREFALQIVDYLVGKDVKMIVIACNTVTAMALDLLRERYPEIPILGVIEPTARRVVQDGVRSVGILGTKVTIASGVYTQMIHQYDPSVRTCCLACPAIVPLVEEGIIENEIMDLTLRHYMDDFVRENDFRDLILGCTHYPLVADNIQRIYPELNLYNSSAEVIREAADILRSRDQLAGPGERTDRFYASDLSENFIRMTERLLIGENANIRLKKMEN